MINYIWGLFILIGIFYSLLIGNIDIINKEIISSGSIGLKIIFQILPLICLWMGLMNIASDSGLLNIISKKMTPIICKLFPEIPSNDESISYISSNIIMNMIGLGNAATPFGLKAMESLQKLNKIKDTASRSMITFLVINTASVTIIPTTIISFRILNGSTNPTDIVLAAIITTVLSCILGLILDRTIYYIWRKNEHI